MLTETTHSATSCFKYVWSENAKDMFADFRENAVRAKEIALWRYKDVLLDVELGLLPFLKLLSLAFILNSVAASLPKMSLSKKRKFDKEYAEFSKTFGPFAAFLRRRMGYLYVWCVHSRFQ